MPCHKSIRGRRRKDGTTAYAVLFNVGIRQSSCTFADEQAAVRFRDTVNAIGGERAMTAWGILDTTKAKPVGRTVGEWLVQYNQHLTGVESGTKARYTAYSKEINKVLGSVPFAALSREVIAEWINGMTLKDGSKLS
ncbi:MAG: hypothetical protein ACM4D3_24020 [Candidatus Sericytochromatia bacterium]